MLTNYPMRNYFQGMPQIGSTLTTTDDENAQQIKSIENELKENLDTVLKSGRSDESLNKSGQLTALQRLEALIDPGTWRPINSLFNPEGNDEDGCSVLTGMAKIEGKWTVIIDFDNKKTAGAWVPGQGRKITRATEIAESLRIPLVYLLNCSGMNLLLQEKLFSGRLCSGTPFYRHARLEQEGMPVLIGIFQTNPAGGGYHAISPSVLIAKDDANFAVGGAGIVGGMTSSKGGFTEESARELIAALTGAEVPPAPGQMNIHHEKTGFVREVYDDEKDVLASLRKYVKAMPSYDADFFRVASPAAPLFPGEDLYTLVTTNQRRAINMPEIVARLVDNSEFSEYKADYGPEIFCGLCRISGYLVGIVGNRHGLLLNYPEYKNVPASLGGKLYRQGLIKMNEFTSLCGRDRIPLIWIQDTTGIDVGDEAEVAEVLALGQASVYSIQGAGIPQMELTLRKASGAAHFLMGGPQANDSCVFSFCTAVADYNPIIAETAAVAVYSRRLVREAAAGKDIGATVQLMNDLVQKYKDTSEKPSFIVKTGLAEECLEMTKIRDYFCAFAEAAYQNPVSTCPPHLMLTPRIIRDYDNLYKK